MSEEMQKLGASNLRRFTPYPSYKISGVEWIKEVPQHWEVRRLKTAALYWVSNVDKVPSEEEIPVRLCNYTDVYYNEHIRPNMGLMETTATAEEIESFRLQVGDVLITKDSEEWDDIAIAALVVDSAPDLICGYHLAIIRPEPQKLFGRFLLRAMQSRAVNRQFEVAATGVTRYGLPKSSIGEALLPLPPTNEQTEIANFLDQETTKIDILVAKKRLLINKLREKRSALISRTVTRGLPQDVAQAAGVDPNPVMKATGIDWISEIPSHWELKRFGHISVVVRGASPRPAGDERYFNGDFIPWITVGEITKDDSIYLSSTETMLTREGAAHSRLIPRDTLVLTNSGATLGVPKILSISGCANDGIIAFLNLRQDSSKPFLYYYLRSLTENLRDRIKQGSGQPNLNTEIVKALPLPWPARHEQNAIAAYLDVETAKIDRLAEMVMRAIQRLLDFRVALITASVTGKIDCRGIVQ